MCGICGIVSAAGADRGRLETMSATLVHRGPDSDGELVDGLTALDIANASLLDAASGAGGAGSHQRISNRR